MSQAIYETDIVENPLQYNINVSIISDEININQYILEMICFELIVNAKKNRWHDFLTHQKKKINISIP
jgi:hypothetical protein